MNPIILRSPAKLNLVLDLLHKREDGYHEVEFVMQELDIHDTITLETIHDSHEIKISCTDHSVPTDEKNSCHKAAKLMQEELHKQNKPVQGVSIHIEKHIPSAGGLGGGSSNAASVLKGLNDLWELRLSKNVLKSIAGKIGSDDSFFIEGGTCIAKGRGEIIVQIEKCPRLDLAFIVPPVKVPADKTRWIYSHYDMKKVETHPSVQRMHEAIRSGDIEQVALAMGNVFETLELVEYAPVFHLIDTLKQFNGVHTAVLAGAGPTVVAVCDSQKTASQIIQPFRLQGLVAFSTHSI